MSEEENESDVMDEWADALAESGDSDGGDSGDSDSVSSDAGDGTDNTELANFDQLEQSGLSGAEDLNLEVILDIPVQIAMEIGRTTINIRNLLQLNQGSVIELDRMAGEPLDVLVNGTLIAHGEVVVVNEKFGIRLTDVISPAERVKKLK